MIASAADIVRHCETVWGLVEPWLPQAQARLRAADGSASDAARWRSTIGAVSRVDSHALTSDDLLELCSAARRLLGRLMEAERPGPSVAEIAARLRELITSGAFPPGSPLSVARIAAGLGCDRASRVRVELALRDLEIKGEVTFGRSNRASVVGEREAIDRPAQIAEWLRDLIKAGVYPRTTELPWVDPLSRSFVSPRDTVMRALDILVDEGVLLRGPKKRPAVCWKLPFPVAFPPDIDSLLAELTDVVPPDMDLSPYRVEEACRRARSSWSSRISPLPEDLTHTIGVLVGAAEQLIPLAALRYADNEEVETRLRRTAVTALADPPPDVLRRTWHAACLGAAVQDILLLLAGDLT
ncbi:GntR family transcriptional regulator [Streptomyces sp. CB02115]|uniref:GntR family transcriptional regulator n=1 Tax=Streptomyces sp. CB02115 TaxID=1703939 RepID=UPI0013010267|nr:GntR family transcriptional regulator [Streptomyces sp. CB02115]